MSKRRVFPELERFRSEAVAGVEAAAGRYASSLVALKKAHEHAEKSREQYETAAAAALAKHVGEGYDLLEAEIAAADDDDDDERSADLQALLDAWESASGDDVTDGLDDLEPPELGPVQPEILSTLRELPVRLE